jgi:hypothetical protein
MPKRRSRSCAASDHFLIRRFRAVIDLTRYRWEGPALAPGRHMIVYDFIIDGIGFWARRDRQTERGRYHLRFEETAQDATIRYAGG